MTKLTTVSPRMTELDGKTAIQLDLSDLRVHMRIFHRSEKLPRANAHLAVLHARLHTRFHSGTHTHEGDRRMVRNAGIPVEYELNNYTGMGVLTHEEAIRRVTEEYTFPIDHTQCVQVAGGTDAHTHEGQAGWWLFYTEWLPTLKPGDDVLIVDRDSRHKTCEGKVVDRAGIYIVVCSRLYGERDPFYAAEGWRAWDGSHLRLAPPAFEGPML